MYHYCDTPAYNALAGTMRYATQTVDKLIVEAEPSLLGECDLPTEQVMTHFHISRRALQNYRDKGIIPYTSIGGTLLRIQNQRGVGTELLQTGGGVKTCNEQNKHTRLFYLNAILTGNY